MGRRLYQREADEGNHPNRQNQRSPLATISPRKDARAKRIEQKEYVDGERSAEYSDIVERDQIPLNKIRENKLSPNFEPAQYMVSQKKGNVVM